MEDRDGEVPRAMTSVALAAARPALLRVWLSGEAPCEPEVLARRLAGGR